MLKPEEKIYNYHGKVKAIQNIFNFSVRQSQIAVLTVEDWTNKEIMEYLSSDPRTLSTHKRRMLEKTSSNTIVGLAIKLQKILQSLENV